MLAKALKAINAKEAVRRSKMSRVDIMQEYVCQTGRCTCTTPGLCYVLIKDILLKNHLDGELQKDVIATLRIGRAKMRNLCLVGPKNCGKSLVFKGLLDMFSTYERPDGGSYQLEDIVNKELVLLNDFEYDDDAKKWLNWGRFAAHQQLRVCASKSCRLKCFLGRGARRIDYGSTSVYVLCCFVWSGAGEGYLKRLLEGGSIPVAKPKNRGGNVLWKSDAPVLMTAPQEISLWRGRKVDTYETAQMDVRVKYYYLKHSFEEAARIECLPCGHCAGRVFLEGTVVAPPRESAGLYTYSAFAYTRICLG